MIIAVPTVQPKQDKKQQENVNTNSPFLLPDNTNGQAPGTGAGQINM